MSADRSIEDRAGGDDTLDRLVKPNSLFDHLTVVNAVLTAPMLGLLWLATRQIDAPWAWTCWGMALMLWPMQIAFWLGQRSEQRKGRPTLSKTGHRGCAQ